MLLPKGEIQLSEKFYVGQANSQESHSYGTFTGPMFEMEEPSDFCEIILYEIQLSEENEKKGIKCKQ